MTVTAERSAPTPKPDFEPEPKSRAELIIFGLVVGLPLIAIAAAVPLAWGWGLGWTDIAIAFVFYVVSGLGVTVGLHRYFTHGSFKAKRPMKIALGIAGSLSLEMSVLDWVATHRKHHKFSDKEGDPHSPWRFGPGFKNMAKGLLYAHMGWLFERSTRPTCARTRTSRSCTSGSARSRSPRWCCPACWAGSSPGPGRARSPRCSGARSSASACCTT
jgi:stearoyl-CoA desaturase (delta-9 desaturase)